MHIETKRIYEPRCEDDGQRILVDRLWPRGVSKEAAALDRWARELAPSDELRKEFGHDAARWDEFRRRYRAELDARPDEVEELLREHGDGRMTLLYAAKDEERNNAVALAEYLREKAG